MRELRPATEGIVLVAKMIQEAGIAGPKRGEPARLEHFLENAVAREEYDFGYEWERGWAVGCRIHVGFRHEREAYDGKKVRRSYPIVDVTWSSTGRSVAAARASVVLYGQVTDLGALIEAVLAEDNWGEDRS